MLDGPVLASHFRGKVVDLLPAHQPAPKLVGALRIHEEIAEVMPHEFLRRVSQKLQQSLVRPDDPLVGTGALHPFDAIFKQVGQFGFPVVQRLPKPLAAGNLDFQRSLLLPQGPRPNLLVSANLDCGSTDGKHTRVFGAHP